MGKHIEELDHIFKRIYEDDISGKISHERFLKLSAECEAEQRELTEKDQDSIAKCHAVLQNEITSLWVRRYMRSLLFMSQSLQNTICDCLCNGIKLFIK